MKKLILLLLLLCNSAYAESSNIIDTQIRSYSNPEQSIDLYIYYVPLDDLTGIRQIAFKKFPITLKNRESVNIPPKNGYYILIHHMITEKGQYTHFSTCNNYMQVMFDQISSNIEVDIFKGDTGYCGVFPAPD